MGRYKDPEDEATEMPNDFTDSLANIANDKDLFKECNQSWKAGRGGRPREFETPQDLLSSALDYFQWCDENPLMEHDFAGRDGKSVMKCKMRAYTWAGLQTYIGLSGQGLRNYKTLPTHTEFLEVVNIIDNIMYNQKFTGAAAGMLNASIISRDLGLVDKIEKESNVNLTAKMETFKIGDQVITFGNG